MKSEELFDQYAEKYDEWYEKNRFAYLSELEAVRSVLPQGKGLEVGVGTSRFAAPLGTSIGIDPSFRMLKKAAKRGITVIQALGEHLPFKEAEFDYVLLIVTLCFVDNPQAVLAESKRVLKPEGKLIIGIVDKDSFLGKAYQDKDSVFYKMARFYSAQEVIELVAAHNFKEITTIQTIFSLPENLKEIESIRQGYGEGGFVVISGIKSSQHQVD
ncbi:MAG: methyltransferase domain-containing protein [bacterium]